MDAFRTLRTAGVGCGNAQTPGGLRWVCAEDGAAYPPFDAYRYCPGCGQVPPARPDVCPKCGRTAAQHADHELETCFADPAPGARTSRRP